MLLLALLSICSWPTNALNGTYNYSVKYLLCRMKSAIQNAQSAPDFGLMYDTVIMRSRYAPWKDGKGDVLREFTDSCRKYGVLPCFYFIADWNCVDEKTLDIPTCVAPVITMCYLLVGFSSDA